MENTPKQTGRVKFFAEKKGFGFIVPENDSAQSIFFHISDCLSDFEPDKDDVVTFAMGTGRDGRPKAVEIVLRD
jgi:cold shock CspA family protein